MRIVGLNVLLYAVNADADQHARARQWWERALNPRVFPRPFTPGVATAKLDAWLARDNVRVVREKDEHWEALKPLISGAGTAGNLTTDAHLAALAISHDAVLVSIDTDFARFDGLRWEDPLN